MQDTVHIEPNSLPDPHQEQEFDSNLTDCQLELTPSERLDRHDGVRLFMEAARKARIKRYGYDPAAT